MVEIPILKSSIREIHQLNKRVKWVTKRAYLWIVKDLGKVEAPSKPTITIKDKIYLLTETRKSRALLLWVREMHSKSLTCRNIQVALQEVKTSKCYLLKAKCFRVTQIKWWVKIQAFYQNRLWTTIQTHKTPPLEWIQKVIIIRIRYCKANKVLTHPRTLKCHIYSRWS